MAIKVDYSRGVRYMSLRRTGGLLTIRTIVAIFSASLATLPGAAQYVGKVTNGDKQTPEKAHLIDEPGHIPAVYRGADPKVSAFEQDLWRDFWKLADDKAYAQKMGVKVAQGQGVFVPLEMGRLYTLTLQADAGINITSEPLKGIYLDMLKQDKQKLLKE